MLTYFFSFPSPATPTVIIHKPHFPFFSFTQYTPPSSSPRSSSALPDQAIHCLYLYCQARPPPPTTPSFSWQPIPHRQLPSPSHCWATPTHRKKKNLGLLTQLPLTPISLFPLVVVTTKTKNPHFQPRPPYLLSFQATTSQLSSSTTVPSPSPSTDNINFPLNHYQPNQNAQT